MPDEWKTLAALANNLTVVAVLVIDLYVLISNKLVTRGHLDDVVKGYDSQLSDARAERDKSVEREEQARRELAANNVTLQRALERFDAAAAASARGRR